MKTKFITLLVLILTLGGCTGRDSRQPAMKHVKTAEVTSEKTGDIISFPGRTVAESNLNLGFRVSGMIERVFVNDGQAVTEGQLLAELNPVDYEIQLAATEAKYNQIKGEAERIIAMHADGVVAENDYDKAVFGLQQAEGLLNNHRNQLAYTKLYAPCSGKIKEVLVNPGEIIGSGMPALTMIDNGVPQVEINIPASMLDRITSCSASCTFMALPGVTFGLSLVSVSPTANVNQLYTVKYAIAGNAANYPKPGMNTTVTLCIAPDGTTSFLIPVTAVVTKGEETFVYRINPQDSVVNLVPVLSRKLSRDGIVTIETISLSDGDLVVASGTSNLSDGDKVSPLPKPSKSNKGGLL